MVDDRHGRKHALVKITKTKSITKTKTLAKVQEFFNAKIIFCRDFSK